MDSLEAAVNGKNGGKGLLLPSFPKKARETVATCFMNEVLMTHITYVKPDSVSIIHMALDMLSLCVYVYTHIYVYVKKNYFLIPSWQ